MQHTDERVDAYISKAAPFAQPILRHLRALIHKACPDVTENIKWSRPFFEHHGVLCAIAAFKQHCAFIFWRALLLSDPHKVLKKEAATGMGHLGNITSLQDLPADKIMLAYIKEAAAINEQGEAPPAKSRVKKDKSELVIPDDLQKALAKNKKAARNFAAMTYSQQKDYAEWVTAAKTDATREKRVATTVEWVAEGKTRNWKYEKK